MYQIPKAVPFNALTPTIRGAVESIQQMTQAPLGLILHCVLSGASLATQTGYTVKYIGGRITTPALYLLAIAASGERKSSVDTLVFNSIKEFFKTLKDETGANSIPIYKNISPYALVRNLYLLSHSAALINDEAAKNFQDPMMDDLTLLNDIWSGSQHDYIRKNESFFIEQSACTISWMIQTKQFRNILKKHGEELVDIGFWARFLICFPLSTQGNRYIQKGFTPDTTGYQAYCQRVREILEEHKDLFVPGNQPLPRSRKNLVFSPDAQDLLVEKYNFIEHQMNLNNTLSEHRQYASKIIENIARVAGIFHVFEGHDGLEISLPTLHSATQIVDWYTNEYICIFSNQNDSEEITLAAQKIHRFLLNYHNSTSQYSIKKNYILQHGPSSIRKAFILDAALQKLSELGLVKVYERQKNSPTGRITTETIVELIYKAHALQQLVPNDIVRALVPPTNTFKQYFY